LHALLRPRFGSAWGQGAAILFHLGFGGLTCILLWEELFFTLSLSFLSLSLLSLSLCSYILYESERGALCYPLGFISIISL